MGMVKLQSGKPGQAKKAPEAAGFVHQLLAATGRPRRDLVRDLYALALHGLFGVLELRLKAAVEVREVLPPALLALFDVVEPVLHARRELEVHDVGEALLHQAGDDLAQAGSGAGICPP